MLGTFREDSTCGCPDAGAAIGFDLLARNSGAWGHEPACPRRSVASMRSMRWPQGHGPRVARRMLPWLRIAVPGPTAGEKPTGARQRRPGSDCRQLLPRGPRHPARSSSTRTRRPRARLPPQDAGRRRACCALGRAGTQTSWGRCGAERAQGPSCATRSRSWWRRRRSRASAAHPGCACSPTSGSPAPAA